MEYEFFIDMFFLITLLFNFLSLYLSSFFLRKTKKYWRLLCASAIGSLWNCFLILYPVFPLILEMLMTVFFMGSVMVITAFGMCDKRKLFKAVCILLFSSAIIGGVRSFLQQFFWLKDWEVIAFSGILCILTEMFMKYTMKERRLGNERYSVRLYYCGKQKEFLALADSGNRLKVPETGAPVSVISVKDCEGFCDSVSSGFYIPYRAVGTAKGLLFATTFEKMEIKKEGDLICIERPVVAISRERLSSNQSFSMLLPEEYVQ